MMEITLLALVTKDRIRYMGKAEVFKIPVLGAIFRALGGFPVARDGTDRKARARLDGDAAGGRPARDLPRRHAPARPEDPAAATGRGLPRVARQRADRSGRYGGHRGDHAQRQDGSRASVAS